MTATVDDLYQLLYLAEEEHSITGFRSVLGPIVRYLIEHENRLERLEQSHNRTIAVVGDAK